MSAETAARRIRGGHLGWEMARFGTPLALGMGLQTTFNLVDAYIIARLDHAVAGPALGAIGICDPLAAIGTIVSYGVSVATAAMISRKQGANDEGSVRRIAWQSLLVILGLSLLVGLAALAGAGGIMEHVVRAKGDVAILGARYLQVIVGGSFSMFLLLHLTTIQRALGSSKTPVVLLVGANVLNLFLAVLLVYGPGDAPPVFSWGPAIASALGIPRMELLGAAWATVIARTIVLVPVAIVVTRRFGLFRADSREGPRKDIIRPLLGLAWPSSTQLVVRIAAMLFTYALVNEYYTSRDEQSASTAIGIVFRIETMALFVGLGWGSAAQTFVGQCLGANLRARAHAAGWWAALYDVVLMALLGIAARAWGPRLVSFFDADPAVLAFAVEYLNWVTASYVGLGVGIVLGSAIQGAGATRQTLRLDALVVLFVQVPLSVVVVSVLDAPPRGLWAVVAATYVAFGIVYAASYRRGAFLDTKLA